MMPPQRVQRSKNWVFTLNNPVNYDLPERWRPYCSFAVWQLELSSSGTPHLQGYVRFFVKKRLQACKGICSQAHWEPRLGTHAEAKAYCQKEDTRVEGPWLYGDDPSPGTRSDLAEVKKAIESGMSLRQIAKKHFKLCAKYFNFFSKYHMMCMKPRNARPEIYIVFGTSGIGKTRAAREAFPNAFWKPKNSWWDGYGFEPTVVFDEFYGWLPFDTLLRILDWYPLIVETKGSSCHFQSYRFVFTSNVHPRDWYPKLSDTRLDALKRRIGEFGTLVYWSPGHYDEIQWL